MAMQTVTATTEISASPARVWAALTEPDLIRQYFFGTQVETTWEPGTPITWSGEYDGKSYRDKGEVLEVVPGERLTVTHYSPLSGQEDVPENYHRVTYRLEGDGDLTRVAIDQDNAPEESVEHLRANWQAVLTGLKELLERS